MAVEALGAEAWAESVLVGDATFVAATPGGVWLGAAPEGTATSPICVLAVRSAPDLNTAFGVRVFSNTLLDVKLAGPVGTTAAVKAAADRADVLLQRQHGAAQGSTVLGAVREAVYALPEPQLIAGQQWFNIILSYRMPTQ